MKRFYVFCDVVLGPGAIKEHCYSVYAVNKSGAINKYRSFAPKNEILRCVKTA
jgi:hypothetical protein